MKKLLVLIIALLVTLSACSSGASNVNAIDIYTQLKDAGLPVGEYVEYTEETDPNNLMNKANQYTQKLDFAITSLEQSGDRLKGGSIEIFKTSKDAKARQEYIASFGALGAENSYIINDTVLLRIDKQITATDAQQYADVFK